MLDKYLLISPTLNVGGAERLRATVAPVLQSLGVEVRVLALIQGGHFADVLRKSGVPVDVLGIDGSLWDWRGQKKLRAYLANASPSVVVSGQFLTNYHSALAKQAFEGGTLIVEEHGFNIWKRPRHRCIDRYVTAPRADGVVACSHAVADASLKVYGKPAAKIRCIPNCVDLNALHRDRLPSGHDRRDLQIPLVVGTIGTLRREKGHLTLLAAWEELMLQKLLPESAELWIVGDGPLRQALEERTRDNVSVRVLGHRNDVGAILRQFSLFVFPSISEGFGIALAEAMSQGIPCIAAAAGGIPEVIEDGRTGLLFQPNNKESLMKAVASALTDLPKMLEMSETAKTEAIERFNPVRYAERLVEFAGELRS